MAFPFSLSCDCCGCAICNDVRPAAILITLSGITGTLGFPAENCPDCNYWNQTYTLDYSPVTDTPNYSLYCPPYEDMVTSCLYKTFLQCTFGPRVDLHLFIYTTAGGDIRGYLEVRYNYTLIWVQKADFLMASGAASLECLSFGLTDEPMVECFAPLFETDCRPATAFDLSIVAA